jgi:hypothetical protein
MPSPVLTSEPTLDLVPVPEFGLRTTLVPVLPAPRTVGVLLRQQRLAL